MPEEYDQNGNRIQDELIVGPVLRMPPAGWFPDRIKNRILGYSDDIPTTIPAFFLEPFVETAFDVDEHEAFQPNVSVVRSDRFPSPTRVLQGGPEIAIEAVSPWDTDRRSAAAGFR